MTSAAPRALSLNERRVLAFSQLRAATDIPELAKLCELPAHTVRYTLNRLRADGIIRLLPLVDFHALGWVHGAMFFSCRAPRSGAARSILERLRAIPRITYISCFSTEPQYEVSFATESVAAVKQLSEEISRLIPIAEKSVCLRISGALSGRKYLLTREAVGAALTTGGERAPITLDDLDRRILHALLTNSGASLAKAASTLGVPATTVRFRTSRLEQSGIIRGYRYNMQVERLRVLDFKLLVFTGPGASAFRSSFEAFVDAHPQVVFRSTCLGPWEFEIDIEVQSAEQAATVCQELRGRFPEEIVRIQALPRYFSTSLLERMFPGSNS